MFLRNYDNIQVALIAYGVLGGASEDGANSKTLYGDGYLNTKNATGAIVSCNVSDSPLVVEIEGICLGNGDTEVTYDDYRLSGSVITNNLVEVSRTVKYNSETGKWQIVLIAAYPNTATNAADITIKEWGLWQTSAGHNTDKYAHSTYCVLLFREVLEEPIVIQANTTGTLTFTIDIPMPNHP